MTTAESLETRPLPPIVLVINDDDATAQMYERVLSGGGEDELWVTSGLEAEAIEYALEIRPDLIVSDIDLRLGQRGRELLRELDAEPRLADVPVVLVADRRPDAAVLQLVDSVLLKPVDPAALTQNVRALVQRSRELRTRSATLRQSVAAVLSRAQRVLARAEAIRRREDW